MNRLALASLAFAAALLAPIAAAAQDDPNSIVITAPKSWVVGRSSTTGAPIVQSVSRILVSYRDLDLRTPAGRDVLTARIASAARKACENLNRESMPNGTEQPSAEDCPSAAAASARAQMDAAIRAAG